MPLTDNLVQFAQDCHWSSLSDTTRDAARMMVGNALALAVGAARLPAVDTAANALRLLGRDGWLPVPGRRDTWAPLDAAMLTGIAIHLEDFDDTHLATVLHPAAPIVPAALVCAQWFGRSGTDVLEASAIGAEVAIRVGLAISPAHYLSGWHVTGTMGRIGAAVATARMLRLGDAEMLDAIAIASTSAGGLTAALGTMTKALHPGRAAADGMEAALLARAGLRGSPVDPLDSPGAFPRIAVPEMQPARALDGLGARWELDRNAFKPYACGVVSHPVIDTGRTLAQAVGDAEVASVTVYVNPVVLDVMGVSEPTSALESKFSAAHCFAVGFLFGGGGPAEFSDACARDPAVAAMRKRVRFESTDTIQKGAARAVLHTRDGAQHRVAVDHATGSAERPMTSVQLRDKARLIVEPILRDGTEAFLDRSFELDRHDVASLMAASVAGACEDGY